MDTKKVEIRNEAFVEQGGEYELKIFKTSEGIEARTYKGGREFPTGAVKINYDILWDMEKQGKMHMLGSDYLNGIASLAKEILRNYLRIKDDLEEPSR